VQHVLLCLKEVYRTDAAAKRFKLSDELRLQLHQRRSAPLMNELHGWLTEQLEQRRVEPNSSLGQAIKYLLNHWEPLTLFLRRPGVPLDNNLCERALKMAIRHRKNSLFYKTQHGADVGDVYMSLIHTCYFAGVDPRDYLTQMQRHEQQVQAEPARIGCRGTTASSLCTRVTLRPSLLTSPQPPGRCRWPLRHPLPAAPRSHRSRQVHATRSARQHDSSHGSPRRNTLSAGTPSPRVHFRETTGPRPDGNSKRRFRQRRKREFQRSRRQRPGSVRPPVQIFRDPVTGAQTSIEGHTASRSHPHRCWPCPAHALATAADSPRPV
jgi:transposase